MKLRISIVLLTTLAAFTVASAEADTDAKAGNKPTAKASSKSASRFTVRSGDFVLTSKPDKIVVRDSSGKAVFDSSLIAKDYFDVISKQTSKRECPHIRVTENFQVKSFVGPFLSMYQDVEIDCQDRETMPIGAHPTVKVRYISIDCRNPENISARDWSSGDFSKSPLECSLQKIFPEKELAQAFKNSDELLSLAPDVENLPTAASLSQVVTAATKNFWPYKSGGGKGLLNRFVFDRVADNKVFLKVGVEQYGAGSSIEEFELQLKIPQAYRKDLLAAAKGREGLLRSTRKELTERRTTHEFSR